MKLFIVKIDGEKPVATVKLWKTGNKLYEVPVAFLAIAAGREPKTDDVFDIALTLEQLPES